MRVNVFNKIIRKPYPLNELPFLPFMSADEVRERIQAPDPLIGMMTIGAMSIACQGLADVKLPSGAVRPLILYLLMAFDSGDGKTTLYDIYYKPFENADKKAKEIFDSLMRQYDISIPPWSAKFKGIERGITKAASKGESTADLERQMEEHIRLKPRKPILRKILNSDISKTAAMEGLEGDGISYVYVTDEGGMAFESEIMLSPGLSNRLWDPQDYISRTRGNRKQIGAKNPRFAIHLLTQHAPLMKFLAKHGLTARESGQMARFLIGGGNSRKGFRTIRPVEGNMTWTSLFNSRTDELLDCYMTKVESGCVEREILEFSDEAKIRWYVRAQQTENQLRDGQYMYDITDFASKMMDIVSRLSAIIHFFCGERGKISVDTFDRAFKIVLWHLDEFKYLFSSDFMRPQYEIDGIEEAQYLCRNYWKGNCSDTIVPRWKLLKNGITRKAARLDPALSYLLEEGAIQLVGGSSVSDANVFIRLMNNYFATLK